MRKLLSFLKKNISLTLIISAVILGVAVGLLGNCFSNESKVFITNNIFGIFQNIFIKVIGYIAGPLIFVTIAISIFEQLTTYVNLEVGDS